MASLIGVEDVDGRTVWINPIWVEALTKVDIKGEALTCVFIRGEATWRSEIRTTEDVDRLAGRIAYALP